MKWSKKRSKNSLRISTSFSSYDGEEVVGLSTKTSIRIAAVSTAFSALLHPATLLPAMRCDIPVFVGSSFDPMLGGTWVKKTVEHYPSVRALALRKNQILL
ncbi:MAG: hypothetical protein ACKO7A_23405, partial [Microcystis sp.]